MIVPAPERKSLQRRVDTTNRTEPDVLSQLAPSTFPTINRAYGQVFRPGRLTVGLVVPLEAYPSGPVPTMEHHLERVRLAEELGFASLWLRDVPFDVPSFGDAGHIHDPFVYLGLLAGATDRIALGVSSIVLPLRHPAHVAKAAASADVLSGGRLLLGIASGDRPDEYPALGIPFDERGERFRESYDYLRRMADDRPTFANTYGETRGIDLLPKPTSGTLPLLVTGSSQQSPEWIARHGDGWMIYPRDVSTQARLIDAWRGRIADAGLQDKPVMQPLYIDLVDDGDARPQPIHLGFRSGVSALREYLTALEGIGVNHVALNLRFHRADIETTLRRLADDLLPDFPTEDSER
ncbi:MAG: LLM class oxidoreductase [Actinomycetota bacterium]